MREFRVGGRLYTLDDAGIRAFTPVPDRGLRLVVDGREVTSADLPPVKVGPTPGGGLAWRLAGQGLVVDVAVEGVDGGEGRERAARVNLTVAGAGRLQHLDVERWAESPGLGQAALGEGWFAALEHPGAEHLGLAVDVDLTRGPFASPPLVVGTTPPGDELTGFWDELDRVRARPARLVVLANNWYQLGWVGRMDHRTVAAEVRGFRKIGDRHDLRLDWYCLDDPWDGGWAAETGLWGRLDPRRFPDGLPSGAPLGLWVSPWGGYYDRHDARVAWGRAHGFEVEDGPWPRLCPAGDRYHRHLVESLARLTAAGVGYWKIDGVQFDCADPGHGHPVGPGGRTAQMDRFASLLDEVRAVRPEVVVAFTTGSNPSPWWLRHADFLWRGGLDDAAPEEYDGGRHERFATYIDACLDALRGSSVPVSAIVTFSVVENRARAYREEGAGLDAWERHCWLLAARGTHHHDLYVAPDSLSAREWDLLAEVLRWARRNQSVLARSRMVGGRPQAGEPYGFLSTDADGRAVLCLRNPSASSRPLPAQPLALLVDLEPVYGRLGDHLDPFEVVVVSGRVRPGGDGASGGSAGHPRSPAGRRSPTG